MSSQIKLFIANQDEQEGIYRLRHEVYADELGQYEPQADGYLRDQQDMQTIYIGAMVKGEIVGFIGITPPESPRYSIDRYLSRDLIPFSFDKYLYEVRALTVKRSLRGSWIFGALMYAALRWIRAHGGTRIMAIGRREVLDLYLRFGFQKSGLNFRAGAVEYELIDAGIEAVQESLRQYEKELEQLEKRVDWRLGIGFRQPLLFLTWSRNLYINNGKIPRRSVIFFSFLMILSCVHLVGSWNYGLEYQGETHTVAMYGLNLIFYAIIISLFIFSRKESSPKLNFIFHLTGFAWLAWIAFPWLGELM